MALDERTAPGLLSWQVLLLAWIAGCFAGEDPLPAAAFLGLLTLFLLSAGWARRPALLASLFPAFALGLAMVSMARPAPPAGLPEWARAGDKVAICGLVEEVTTRPECRVQAILSGVRPQAGGQPLPGRLVLTWDAPPAWPAAGTELSFAARIRPLRTFRNDGTWDYAAYMARQGVFFRAFGSGGEVVASARAGEADERPPLRSRLIEAAFGGPAGVKDQGRAMLLAVTSGDRYFLSTASVDLMRRASLSHALALSGFNIVFAAGFGVALAWAASALWPGLLLRLPRQKLCVLFGIPFVLAYLWLGDFQPSLVRAAVMYGFWGLLFLLGRDRAVLDGLFLALAIMLLPAPLAVHDPGLQLSVLAVVGLALLYPPVHRLLSRRLVSRPARLLLMPPLAILASSLCVQFALLPLLAVSFGSINPHLHLNVVWLPVIGWVAMPLGLLGLCLGQVQGLEAAAAAVVDAGSWSMDLMLGSLASLDRAGLLGEVAPLRPLWPAVLGYWTLLLALAVPAARGVLGRLPVAAGLGLLLLPALAGGLAEVREEGVRLTVLDVGQGQSLVVTAPGGGRTLIDGGGFSFGHMDVGQAVVGPTLTHGRPPVLDRIVLSHPDADHLLGLIHPLRTFRVGEFAFAGQWPAREEYRARLASALEGAGLQPRTLTVGQVLDLGRGLVLEVLHPSGASSASAGSTNDDSVVLRLAWRGRGLAILPGDVERAGLRTLLASGADLSAEVLVLPHHGAKSSRSPALYGRVGPRLALASAEAGNRWGMPGREVVEDLGRLACPVLDTGRVGMIEVSWSAPDAPATVRTVAPPVGP